MKEPRQDMFLDQTLKDLKVFLMLNFGYLKCTGVKG